MPELSPQRAAFLAQDFCRGFILHCRLQPEHIAWGIFHSSLQVEECHRQQDGFIHAGVMATMADHTAGYAGFTVTPETHQILTVEFKINFLRPASGRSLLCTASVLKPGRSILVAESEIFDHNEDQSVRAAKATVTLMAVPKERLAKNGGESGQN